MDGFFGHRCSENVDECLSSPCKNGWSYFMTWNISIGAFFSKIKLKLLGATCLDGRNTYYCICAAGFVGKESELFWHCMSQMLILFMKQYFLNDAFILGDNCEVNKDDCNGRPCGRGRCIDGVNSFRYFI